MDSNYRFLLLDLELRRATYTNDYSKVDMQRRFTKFIVIDLHDEKLLDEKLIPRKITRMP